MIFDVPAESYDRFMGAWSRPLAPQLANLARVRSGQRVLDVGCGPGSLTAELVARLGAASVSAVDPSEPFVVAAKVRHPGVDVRSAQAEALPFPDSQFDAALAQLVVHFMADPVAGLREMARVTRRGGSVAACVWDYAGRRDPLGPFWEAARTLHPDVTDESALAGARKGHLAELFEAAGLTDIEDAELSVSRSYDGFDDWWEPFTAGVGRRAPSSPSWRNGTGTSFASAVGPCCPTAHSSWVRRPGRHAASSETSARASRRTAEPRSAS